MVGSGHLRAAEGLTWRVTAKGNSHGRFPQFTERNRGPPEGEPGLTRWQVARAVSPAVLAGRGHPRRQTRRETGRPGLWRRHPCQDTPDPAKDEERGACRGGPYGTRREPSRIRGREEPVRAHRDRRVLSTSLGRLSRTVWEAVGSLSTLVQGWPGCSYEPGYGEGRQREGRDGAGTVFVLTSSGLRHMGLRPGPARPN